MEDLQRDTYLLTHGDSRAGFAHRMEQMHFTPDGGCFSRAGGSGRPIVIVSPLPVDADTAAAAAVVISLAKGWDTQDTVRRPVFICLEGQAMLEADVCLFGPMAPGELSWQPTIHSGTPDPKRPIEGLDYRILQQQTAAIFTTMDERGCSGQ